MTASDRTALEVQAAAAYLCVVSGGCTGCKSKRAAFVKGAESQQAEIDALRELLARNHRAYLIVQGIDPDAALTEKGN